MNVPNLWDGAEVISTYSRADALADGVLRGVDPSLAGEAGVRVPVAMTAAAWAEAVAVPEGLEGSGQSERGRLWDVLWVLACTIRRSRKAGSELRFSVLVLGAGREAPRPVHLKSIIGPGDAGEPVLTILLPDED